MDAPLDLRAHALMRNDEKLLFTPGPAALLPENLQGLRACFGRGDEDYAAVERRVLDGIRALCGQERIVRLQGSASLALEIAAMNFLHGRVLVVECGYYAARLLGFAQAAMASLGAVRSVETVAWDALDRVDGTFDWVVSCYVETSHAVRLPIDGLQSLCRRVRARLLLDATASIGLETGHDLADVLAFSSCKGLFGLTGAAFVAYRGEPGVEVPSFGLALASHAERRTTGPYHALCSLDGVLPIHEELRHAVRVNKERFASAWYRWLPLTQQFQPWLCTRLEARVSSRDPRAVLYTPRSAIAGSVVCHLGEVHLGKQARGAILDALTVEPLVGM